MNKYIIDFLSGDSRKWSIKHYAIYITITITIAFMHGLTFNLFIRFLKGGV